MHKMVEEDEKKAQSGINEYSVLVKDLVLVLVLV
jgi:hypothetical protein